MTSNSKICSAIAIVLFFFFRTSAQEPDNTQFTQGNVNDSATLSLNVPLSSYKGRGLDLPVSLSYSSSIWRLHHIGRMRNPETLALQNVTEARFSEHATGGWTSSLGLPRIEFPDADEKYNYFGRSGGPCSVWSIPRVTIYMPRGETYQLRKSDTPVYGTVDQSGTYYAVDGSRVKFENVDEDTWTLWLPDGSRYYYNGGSAQVIDRHGNTMVYNGGTRIWTDTLGRQIPNPLPATPAVGETDYYLPGLNGVSGGTLHYKFKWEQLGDALTNEQDQLRYQATHHMHYWPNGWLFPKAQNANAGNLFHTATGYDIEESQPHPYPTMVIGQGADAGAVFNPVVLTEITLPDNTKYQFSYNVYGEIDKVVHPTNAFEKYEYESPEVDTTDPLVMAGQPYVQAERRIKTRGVSENGLGNDLIELEYGHDRYEGITTVTAPDGSYTKTGRTTTIQTVNSNFGYEPLPTGTVLWKKSFSAANALLRREVFEYESTTNPFSATSAPCQSSTSISGTAYRNTRIKKAASLIFESGSSSALSQVTSYTYDTTHEMTTGVDQTGVQTRHFTVLDAGVAANIAIGDIPLGSVATTTETIFSTSSTYRDANILGIPTVSMVKNASGTIVSQSEMAYDECPQYCTTAGKALPTSMRTWDSTKGLVTNPSAFLVTRAKFDQWGNRTEATDAMENTTITTYDPTHHAYPISVTTPIPDPSGVNGSNSAFTSTVSFDITTGLVLSTTDANGQTSTMEYNDALLRPTKAIAPNGHQTITEYGTGTDVNSRWVKVKTQIDAEKWSEAVSKYDGLGRTYFTKKIDGQGNIATKTEFDITGRVLKSSNPYKVDASDNPAQGETIRWTTPEYDDLSRTKKVISPDTATVQFTFELSTTGVIGVVKTATDQAGKKRRGITDASGKMIRVIEDPDGQNLTTDYTYDTLGNLRKTIQGEQSRYFLYNSTGRLVKARQIEQTANPGISGPSFVDPITGNDQWTISYDYDNNGNITSTTDARNNTITGTYDRTNRLIVRDYSGSTPDESFFYDGTGLGSIPAFSKGKVTKVTSTVSENRNTSFDQMGRLLSSQQITSGQTYTFGYSYNLSGALIEQTYPSGRIVKNTLNADGELSQIQSRKNGNYGFFTYADSFTYNAAGAATKMQLGNGKWETAQFNDRLQVTQLGLGSTDATQNLLKLEFGYGTSLENNGSMRSQTMTVPTVGANQGFVATQTYAYDNLNRIQSATETISGNQTWKQTFTIDRYGNRRFDAANTTTLGSCQQHICNPTVNTSDNRFSTGQGYVYDSAGNVTQDATYQRFGYDAANRQKEFFSSANGTSMPDASYHYDGEGRRVKKINGSEVTVFVYDGLGKLTAEYSTTVVPAAQAKVSYLTTDHLGSPRIITDQNGVVTSRKDFDAFGDETITSQRTIGSGYIPPNVRQDYTGYSKESESGLEFAQNRYYNTGHGRFTSVDPLTPSASIRNPQTFNRYSYVTNSPYKFTDPLGLMHASQGWDNVAPGFWGTDLNNGRVSAGQQIISAAMALYDALTARSFQDGRDARQANKLLRQGKIQDAQAIVDANKNLEMVEARQARTETSVRAVGDDIPGNEDVGIEVIIWDKSLLSVGRQMGHVSYIIDGVSYSWQMHDGDGDGKQEWLEDTPEAYIKTSSKTSGATGYVLDFGSDALNNQFKEALKGYYLKKDQNYDLATNNCGAAFHSAVNTIRQSLGVIGNLAVEPSSHKTYIERRLSPYIVGSPKPYPKTGGGWFK